MPARKHHATSKLKVYPPFGLEHIHPGKKRTVHRHVGTGIHHKRAVHRKGGFAFAPLLIPLLSALAAPLAKRAGEAVRDKLFKPKRPTIRGRGVIRAGSTRLQGGLKKKHRTFLVRV